jgi:hypothetical protein
MIFRAISWSSALVLASALAGCGEGDQSPSGASAGVGGQGGAITGAGGSTSSSSSSSSTSSWTSSSVASSGAGGEGGAGFTCPPKPPLNGIPVNAPPKAWTWIDVAGAQCRDGSPTGFGFRRNPDSKKLFIYLEGGGACFNGTTCGISLAAFGKGAFDAWKGTVGQTGVFDPNAAENPLKSWNAVYVPYCTGDIHGGNAVDKDVPGLGTPKHQAFVGYANLGLYLKRLIPTFPELDQVLLTGISAGGFGAAYNYDRVATAFCPTPVALLDDSGPPMSDSYLAPCLQKQWKGLWNLGATLPPGCPECNGANGGGIVNYVPYLRGRWPNAPMGLISATHDSVISTFFGFGSDECSASTPLSGAAYEAGLEELRDDYLSSSPNWGTYYIDSASHTWLLGPGFYTTKVNGKKLSAWVGELLNGQPSNIGP